MNRRILYFLMIVALFCTLLVGCGDNDQTGSTTSPANATTQGAETIDSQNTESLDSTRSTETDETVPLGYVITYSEYIKLTANQQMEIMKQFESKEAFDNWLAEIKQDYEKCETIEKPSHATDSTEIIAPIFPEATDVSIENAESISYQEFIDMTANEQKAFINTFANYDEFVIWYNAALQEHKDSMIEIVGTGPINVGE